MEVIIIRDIKIGHISDLHFYGNNISDVGYKIKNIRKVPKCCSLNFIERINNNPNLLKDLDYLIVTGDIIYADHRQKYSKDKDVMKFIHEAYEKFKTIIKQYISDNTKVILINGNHDYISIMKKVLSDDTFIILKDNSTFEIEGLRINMVHNPNNRNENGDYNICLTGHLHNHSYVDNMSGTIFNISKTSTHINIGPCSFVKKLNFEDNKVKQILKYNELSLYSCMYVNIYTYMKHSDRLKFEKYSL